MRRGRAKAACGDTSLAAEHAADCTAFFVICSLLQVSLIMHLQANSL